MNGCATASKHVVLVLQCHPSTQNSDGCYMTDALQCPFIEAWTLLVVFRAVAARCYQYLWLYFAFYSRIIRRRCRTLRCSCIWWGFGGL